MIDFSKDYIVDSTAFGSYQIVTPISTIEDVAHEWCYMSEEMQQEANKHHYNYHQVCTSGGEYLVLCRVVKYNINGVYEVRRIPIKQSNINYTTGW